MGALFHRLQAQCNPPKVYCGHRVTLRITEYLTIISRHRSTAPRQTMSKPSVKPVRKRPGCSGQPASYHFIEIVIAFAGSEADAASNRARFERPLKQSIRTGTSLNFTSDILIELQISGFQLGIKGSCSATESRIDGLAIESRNCQSKR